MRTDMEICKENGRNGRAFERKARRKKTIRQNGLTNVMQKNMDADLDANVLCRHEITKKYLKE